LEIILKVTYNELRYTVFISIVLIFLSSCKTFKKAEPDVNNELPKETIGKKDYILTATFIEGISEKTKGNLDKALILFKRCLEIDKHNAPVYFEVSKVYANMANLSEAINYIDNAIEIDALNIWYKLHKAEILEYANLNEYAADVYQVIVNRDDNPQYLISFAENLVYSKQYEKAIDVFLQLEKNMGSTPELTNKIYQLYMEVDKSEKALQFMEKATANNPNDIAYLGMLAVAYEESGKLEKAVETYQKMLEIDESNPRIHLALYKYYSFKKDEEQAMASLNEAFKSEALEVDAKMQILILMYEEIDRHPEKLEQIYPLLDQLVATHPKSAKVHAIYGDFLLKDGKKKEARDAFAKALEFDSEKFLIWNQVMFLDMEINDKEALFKHSSEALELYPNQPGTYYFKGYAQFLKSEYTQAIETLELGLGILIDNPELEKEFYQTLGDANYRLKQKDQAYSYYDKSLKLLPDNPYILNNYAYYLALDGINLEKAASMAKKANELVINQASYLDTYAWILFKMEDYKESKEVIQKALNNGGIENPVILEHMGDVLYKTGEKNQALKYWEKAKQFKSTSKTIDEKISTGSYVE